VKEKREKKEKEYEPNRRNKTKTTGTFHTDKIFVCEGIFITCSFSRKKSVGVYKSPLIGKMINIFLILSYLGA
jgi:hypothetical protein